MAQYNVGEAKAHFSELVNKAMIGEDVFIAKDNMPVVRIVAIGLAVARFSSWPTTLTPLPTRSRTTFLERAARHTHVSVVGPRR
jgi:prevent-host-death family protein